MATVVCLLISVLMITTMWDSGWWCDEPQARQRGWQTILTHSQTGAAGSTRLILSGRSGSGSLFSTFQRFFEGSYRDTSDKFQFPFQTTRESVGHASSFQLKVAKEPVKFISFMQKNWKQ